MSLTFVSHLECSLTGKRYEAGRIQGLSEAGRPLLVRYDLARLASTLKKSDFISKNIDGFWRYASLLPVSKVQHRISLGEVVTPLIEINQFSSKVGGLSGNILVKDEGRLPT